MCAGVRQGTCAPNPTEPSLGPVVRSTGHPDGSGSSRSVVGWCRLHRVGTLCGRTRGRVAELVDAHGSGPCPRKRVEVQVLSRPLLPKAFSCWDQIFAGGHEVDTSGEFE